MVNLEVIEGAIWSALAPGHFFVADPGRLRVEHVASEETPWEVFRGHLLDAAQTTLVKRFESWHVLVDDTDPPDDAPLVSVHWDRQSHHVFVVRHIFTHGFEAYEDTPGVILSRPVKRSVRELVGTIELSRLSPHELLGELQTHLFLAVIGTSRLPITSLESPLPAFSLGRFFYFPKLHDRSGRPWHDPIEMLEAALDAELTELEAAKALETALRAASNERQPQIARVVETYAATGASRWNRVRSVVRCLFNHVALSPYTEFVDRMIVLLLRLSKSEAVGAAAITDVFSSMLTHLCRHLTAFDLKTFHNFGANYPDALFLDALLRATLRLLEDHRDLFADNADDSEAEKRTKRRRRRALRQACLLRKHYEGHAVPDAPTSQGGNLRVLPAPFGRVPEEQIMQAGRRRRTLFADEPTESVLGPAGQEVLHASLADLENEVELRELGMAYFLDRPLGAAKQPGQLDRTPLLSYAAFSRSIARQRLDEFERSGWIAPDQRMRFTAAVDGLAIAGVPVGSLALVERPGVVSLADAAKAAPDFSVLRTTWESFDKLVQSYDWTAVGTVWRALRGPGPAPLHDVLLVQCAAADRSHEVPTIRLYDFRGRLRVELGFPLAADATVAYAERGDIEMPERLQVLRIWEDNPDSDELTQRDVRACETWIARRDAIDVAQVELP